MVILRSNMHNTGQHFETFFSFTAKIEMGDSESIFHVESEYVLEIDVCKSAKTEKGIHF